MHTLYQLLISAVAVMLTAYFMRGVEVKGFGQALVTALLLALVNTFVKPILIILTIPFTVVTLGLFLLVINALLVYLVSAISPGFKVRDFGSAFVFSILLAVINWILSGVFS